MLSVNAYFEDQVMSIAFEGESLATTVGVMSVGEFIFGTSQYERMTVIDGALEVKLPGHDNFQSFVSGDKFEVTADSSFAVRVLRPTAYHCTYE
jgi:uncharacterized protein YaiE (UPF0345 family)|tara:strand:- start:100 stop:381 length:282 start_codon:yes stop_codon:yes gene_type:complete